jgi:glycosyltransferase involved in cell wall biosynthesis
VKILQVSASDRGGGAHLIAKALHRGLLSIGHDSAMAVGRLNTDEAGIYRIPSRIGPRRRRLHRRVSRLLRPFPSFIPGLQPVRRALRSPRPISFLRARLRGRENFDYPGTRSLLSVADFRPELVHLHNLHTEYFDLRYLPELSDTVPVAMTLHDEWTYTGHCAYTMGIERWRTGCHSCPDLDVYPAIRRGATHENWLAKRAIYERSRLYVSAPSRWLLDRARESMLAAGVVDWRLIPNGVDRSQFRPLEHNTARDLLGLPRDSLILLFAANLVGTNPFKDHATVAAAARLVADRLPHRPLLLLALGGEAASQRIGNAELRFLPYEQDRTRVAAYYQAADVYLHAANADTFPTTILEGLASGRPVVATAVGGIEEQIRSLAGAPGAWPGASESVETATGVLISPHDASGMAAAAAALLVDDELRFRLGRNAAADAADRFDADRQLDLTISWYRDCTEDWLAWRRASQPRGRAQERATASGSAAPG